MLLCFPGCQKINQNALFTIILLLIKLNLSTCIIRQLLTWKMLETKLLGI